MKSEGLAGVFSFGVVIFVRDSSRRTRVAANPGRGALPPRAKKPAVSNLRSLRHYLAIREGNLHIGRFGELGRGVRGGRSPDPPRGARRSNRAFALTPDAECRPGKLWPQNASGAICHRSKGFGKGAETFRGA